LFGAPSLSRLSSFPTRSPTPIISLSLSLSLSNPQGYPPGHLINYVTWSKSGASIAFTTRSPGGPGDPAPRGPLHLWVADAATGLARRLLGGGDGGVEGLNAVFEDYAWIDEGTIVAAVIPPGRGPPPTRPPAPGGPKIQCNVAGATSQGRTYQDLLSDPDDEAAFEYYGASLLARVCVATGDVTFLRPPEGGPHAAAATSASSAAPSGPRLYCAAAPSPDGAWLAVSWLDRPFSYAFPCGRFPRVTELWKLEEEGKEGASPVSVAATLARLPLATSIPIAMDSVRTGPRGLAWRPDAPAALSWLEAQDGGDPGAEPAAGPDGPRDILFTTTAPAAAAGDPPVALASTAWRCSGAAWGGPDLALLYESRYKTRTSRVWAFEPGAGDADATKAVLFERCFEDAYGDPGSPALVRSAPHGTYVLARPGGGRRLLLQGAGASPEGNRPFVDVFDVDTKAATRIWQSTPPFHETAGSLLTTDTQGGVVPLAGMQLLATRETEEDPPQTHVLTFGGDLASPAWADRTLTDFPHPHPTLKGAAKKILRYKREDGVELTATLHTPPGWVAGRDAPLPTFVWTYPREFKSADAAGQLRRSHHEFASISPHGPLTLLARGYAVLDGPTVPIIAVGAGEDAEPNDEYVSQLVAGARAAVQAAVEAGATDPARVAIGGHSYGAFTAANLLARAPGLFACGVARSGAYNRTLTPMGFQAEERTLWQAPAVYEAMSAFHVADKVSAPLLLIHGDADSNPGTHTLQSERMYSALKGHGVPARLVLLPHEGHGYRGRESVLHVLAETEAWLDKWCKKEGEGEEGGE